MMRNGFPTREWTASWREDFQALVAAGGDSCAALDSDGYTLLHIAARRQLEELATLLLSSKVGKSARKCLLPLSSGTSIYARC